jgi:hypothetical protein
MWDTIFNAANVLSLACWATLIVAPRGEIARALVFYGGIGLLCLVYTVLLVGLVSGLIDSGPVVGSGVAAGQADLTTIAGIRSFFGSDGGVTVGWVHYLAFDLFAGMWIARDADAKQFSRWWQAPVLVLTWLAGPVGLLLWLAIREPAARRANPRSGPNR